MMQNQHSFQVIVELQRVRAFGLHRSSDLATTSRASVDLVSYGEETATFSAPGEGFQSSYAPSECYDVRECLESALHNAVGA